MLRNLVLEYRSSKNMTMEDFANLIGVSPPTIAKIERGEMPSKLVIAKVAHLLGVSYGDLVKGEENK